MEVRALTDAVISHSKGKIGTPKAWPWKNFDVRGMSVERARESVELKPGILGIELDLKKLFSKRW